MVTKSPPAERNSRRLKEAEERAVKRWRPGQRWYHPAIAKLVIATSRFITNRMNKLEVEGREHLDWALERAAGRGLLSISNHSSLFDDPILMANFVRGPYHDIRWVGADALNFFGSPFKAWLFTAGKSAPIVRGVGLDQPGMLFLRDRLAEGAWVHMFPEGGRTRDAGARMNPDFKPGTGWLIAEAKPLVLPFYHHGMQHVLPVGSIRPRRGHIVSLLFGEPIDCDEAWIEDVATRRGSAAEGPRLWEALSAEMHSAMAALEQRLHPALAGKTPA